MTEKQTQLYWREYAAWKRARDAKGLPSDTAARHALTAKALGRPKSSKALTNADLDKVLAAFRAESRPADLNAQLRQQDQAKERTAALLEQCWQLCADLTDAHSLLAIDARSKIQNYLGTLTRSVAKKRYEDCNERDLAQVRGILSRRLEKIERDAITAPLEEDQPF